MRRSHLRALPLALGVLAVLGLAATPAPAPAASKRRPAPLKAPAFRITLLTRDPVAVLDSGVLEVRVTARRTASIRLRALAGDAQFAAPQTFRFRTARTQGMRSKTFTLKLGDAA